jgi:hypothetical protein
MTYRCPCGFEKAVVPQHGREIVSVYHLHEHKRFDGHADPARMEPVGSFARESSAAGVGVFASIEAH